jgi:hypothetical protein
LRLELYPEIVPEPKIDPELDLVFKTGSCASGSRGQTAAGADDDQVLILIFLFF